MHFTPIVPQNTRGQIEERLFEKSESVCIKSAGLIGSHTPQLLDAVREILRVVNSYYSNKIESEGTHPIDIEKAFKKDFSADSQEHKLQLLSIAYIKTQQEIEKNITLKASPSPYSKDFLLWIHKTLYKKEGMERFLDIDFDGMRVTMEPGSIRDLEVRVGGHIAPKAKSVEDMLNQFENLYGHSLGKKRVSERLIYALSSHHRLTWIHPFLDGNGRTSRLALDGALHFIGFPGYGLWNISRGLAKQSDKYKSALANADMPRHGDLDGRGELSNKMLFEFVDFMLDSIEDQVEYMGRHLKLNELSARLDRYIAKSQTKELDIPPLPKYSGAILKHLLLVGESPRGLVKEAINTSERTARGVISQLGDMGYITSETPKSAIKFKINAHLASYLFPEIVPER